MTTFKMIEKLAAEKNQPCVTISINTHRTHPENQQDKIVLKNLINEAIQRVETEFGKDASSEIAQKLQKIEQETDINYLEESLHIFVSKDSSEILKSIWPTKNNVVKVDDHFDISPLIVDYNRAENYLVLSLAEGGTELFHAKNGRISEEVKNQVFPFGESLHLPTDESRRSDAEYMDSLLKEYFRDVDKALVDYLKDSGEALKVVVITTEANYSMLKEVATQPEIYAGFASTDKAKNAHHFAEKSWEIIQKEREDHKDKIISEVREAQNDGKLIADLSEAYRAAVDGRAEILVMSEDFSQPVKLLGNRDFEYIDDADAHGAVDDVSGKLAWEVLSKGGKVYFVPAEKLNDLGDVVLKTRY